MHDKTVSVDAWLTMQSHTRNAVTVVDNLTLQQRRAFSEDLSPQAFFPHVGLFGKDFVIGALVLRK
jgi:hypothetical protein